MTERDDLAAKRRLASLAREAEQREAFSQYGSTSNEYDRQMRDRAQGFVPRADQISVEAIKRTVVFLRQVFSQHPQIIWRGGDGGLTDLSVSKIIIETDLSPRQRAENLELPMLEVSTGPVTMPETVLGNLKHKNLLRGTESYTGLAAGTMQVLVTAKIAAQALDLANFVGKVLRLQWRDLCHQGFQSIGEIAVGDTRHQNPVMGRAVTSTERSCTVPVTFTYFHQWTAHVNFAPGSLWEVESILSAGGSQDLPGGNAAPDASELQEAAFVLYAAPQIEQD